MNIKRIVTNLALIFIQTVVLNFVDLFRIVPAISQQENDIKDKVILTNQENPETKKTIVFFPTVEKSAGFVILGATGPSASVYTAPYLYSSDSAGLSQEVIANIPNGRVVIERVNNKLL